MSRTRWIAASLLLLAGCSHTSSVEPVASAPNPNPPAADPGVEPAPPVAAPATGTPPPDPPPRPGQLRFDLLAHPERAELRVGATHFMDYGEPGDARYTLHGWLTGAGGSVTLDDARLRIAPGKRLKLALPAESDAAATLRLRVRGFRPGPLTVYVNDATVGNEALDGKGLQSFEFALPAGLLQRGENLLQLRVSRTGSARGVPSAGLGVDWIALGPAAAAGDAGQVPASPFADPARLQLAAGVALGYTLQVPDAARLVGRLQGEPGGALELWALRDGAPAQRLSEWQTTGAEQAFEQALGALAGELVRLELRARGRAVGLAEARVVTEPVPLAAAGRPIKNVVIVLVDTLRADKLSPYNQNSRVKTPGLSTFLTRAAVMTRARTQENWTKPSVATLLSSLMPWQHNAYTDDAKVPESVELLPEHLRAKGFYTGAFIANGYVSDKFGFKQGWHSYRNYIREGRRTKAQYVAADVLDWLDARPKDKPFFLYMHTIDPHVPYRPPNHFLDMYDAGPYSGVVDFSRSSTLLEDIKVGKLRVDTRDKERLAALYDAEISYHDVHFAAVMEGLEKRGLADDTLVLMTADHGEEFWDHGSVGHGHSVYDELLHIPMIVRIPGLTDGKQRVSEDVGLVDVMPTILEALGEAVPEELAGRSFLPLLRGEGRDVPRSSVSGFMTGWRTASEGRFKLVQRTLDHYWLYDTGADPGETTDLAAAQPLALRHMRGVLGLSLAAADHETSVAAPRARPAHRQEKTVIDKQTEAQLRALGYVGSTGNETTDPGAKKKKKPTE